MEQLQGRGEPKPSIHGSFSLWVNYHAIGEYVAGQGGTVLHPGHRHASLNVSAFLFGEPPEGYVDTRQAYEETVNTFGPDDFFALKKATEKACEDFTVDQALALLRLSGWDARILMGCFPALLRQLEDAGDAQKREVHAAIEEVWRTYYPIGEKTDVAFHLGTLLYQMDCYAEAIVYLERSLNAYGHQPGTDYNMALCYQGLRQTEKAREWADRALELDPDFEPAKAFLAEIERRTGA
jgi:tetratricopeptide (TPR) repeat protein